MLRAIRLNYDGIQIIKEIREDIITQGQSYTCPQWIDYLNTPITDYTLKQRLIHRCKLCKDMFPKVSYRGTAFAWVCPCHVYTPKYLIMRLSQILQFNSGKGR